MKARLPQGYGGGGAGNLNNLAKQAQKMQGDMATLTAELEEKTYEATAGGNAVKVAVSGRLEVTGIEIEPEVVDPDDVEMLSDLVMAAVNEAIRKANEDKETSMEKITGGLNLPGMF